MTERNASVTCSTAPRSRLLILLALLAGALTGCGLVQPTVQRYHAQYRGLEGQRVAVLVTAPDDAVARQPDLAEELAALTATAIRQADVVGETGEVVDPRTVTAYQQRHPFWPLQSPQQLYAPFDAGRLIMVDLTSFRLRDPDNNYLWLGTATAQVTVYEADARDPANPRFAGVVASRFPEGRSFGLTTANPREMALALGRTLARDIARLFHDYEVRP